MINYCSDYRKRLKWSIPIALITIIIIEWLEYALMPLLHWPKFPVLSSNSIKILIVGDPQLLGNKFSGPHVLGFICRWDADRYVKKTFNIAFNYMIPDLVIFLGDNLDEGENSNDEEFSSYVHRFKNVFQGVNFDKAIILPGDNDIGGEDEPPSLENQRRFQKYFRDDIFLRYKFLEFVKINYITHSNSYLTVPNITEGAIRIILSHIPLTPAYSSFISRVIPYVQPHLILSAHDHKSSHFTAERKSGIIFPTATSLEFNSCIFNISNSTIHEIMAPTCSYRMGTHKMGYGALEISDTGKVSYAVLWLPSRFRQLFLYVVILAFFIFIMPLLTKVCRNLKVYHRIHSSIPTLSKNV